MLASCTGGGEEAQPEGTAQLPQGGWGGPHQEGGTSQAQGEKLFADIPILGDGVESSLTHTRSNELNLKVIRGLTEVLLLQKRLQISLTLTKSKKLNLKVTMGLTDILLLKHSLQSSLTLIKSKVSH
jgi:hypothetical protein